MTLDLEKLSPAPWCASWQEGAMSLGEDIGFLWGPKLVHWDRMSGFAPVDAAFMALSRNAFDVMIRRGWSPEGHNGEWAVIEPDVDTPDGIVGSCLPIGGNVWPDPFTALVEADKWYKENLENQK